MRKGCGISEETKRLVYLFYLDHHGIKRSPLRGDTLLLMDEQGQKVPVS